MDSEADDYAEWIRFSLGGTEMIDPPICDLHVEIAGPMIHLFVGDNVELPGRCDSRRLLSKMRLWNANNMMFARFLALIRQSERMECNLTWDAVETPQAHDDPELCPDGYDPVSWKPNH